MTVAVLLIVAGLVLLYAGIRGVSVTGLLHGSIRSAPTGGLLS